MKEKSACLISCSDHYNHRLNVAASCLQARGYSVTYITSDFDHVAKQAYYCPVPGCVQIATRPYRKNLSVARILSHREFARAAFRYIESLEQQPEVLVVLLPPNYLTKYAAGYKKKHPEVRLVFDVFDLWPETFPSKNTKTALLPVFRAWAGLRDRYLKDADAIITECDLFRHRLGLSKEFAKTVYLAGELPSCGILPAKLSSKQWDICYLGSVNNIIDIGKIAELLRQMSASRPVVLHIIGAGERLQELMIRAREAGAEITYHGAVFDDLKKQEIMSRCHFGLNILKEATCIGLTMKSVDYLRNGLPIINNVPADSSRLLHAYHCGIACDGTFRETIQSVNNDMCLTLRHNAQKLFADCFDRRMIVAQYDSVLERVL